MGETAHQIGRILRGGRLVSQHALDATLAELQHAEELLGQVLVRMGILSKGDDNVPQLAMTHSGNIDNAVRLAAGERQLLGELLAQSGHITDTQLELAVAEHQRSGEKLGDVFTRFGYITKPQLKALLDFQNIQGASSTSPLRLGNLLVEAGHITCEQLENALHLQSLSRKKLGEVLIDAGYVLPDHVTFFVRLQKMVMTTVLAAILSFGMTAESKAGTVELQWDPITQCDISGYKVYFSTDATTLADSIPIDVNNMTNTTISGLDPEKSYTFAIAAYDTSGQESPLSNILTISELAPPDVAITSPENATSVSGTVSISVNAVDNVGVTRVEFFINDLPVATVTTAPYEHLWDTSTQSPGVYTLMVKAYDAAGNVSQSSALVINDDQRPPASTLQAAYDMAAADGSGIVRLSAADIIPANDGVNPEFNASSDREVVISGGFDASNQTRNGVSIVAGVMKISAGTIIADGITIR
jgi:chitodextrinase